MASCNVIIEGQLFQLFICAGCRFARGTKGSFAWAWFNAIVRRSLFKYLFSCIVFFVSEYFFVLRVCPRVLTQSDSCDEHGIITFVNMMCFLIASRNVIIESQFLKLIICAGCRFVRGHKGSFAWNSFDAIVR